MGKKISSNFSFNQGMSIKQTKVFNALLLHPQVFIRRVFSNFALFQKQFFIEVLFLEHFQVFWGSKFS